MARQPSLLEKAQASDKCLTKEVKCYEWTGIKGNHAAGRAKSMGDGEGKEQLTLKTFRKSHRQTFLPL